MPPYRREIPASSAASENVRHDSLTGAAGVRPGSTFELPAATVTDAPNLSLPVKSRRISAPAALKVLWPDAYSGNGGVGNVGGWNGNHSAPSISCVPRPGPAHARTRCPSKSVRIAVIGRTETNAHLLSHAQMPASKIAFVSAKKSFTS